MKFQKDIPAGQTLAEQSTRRFGCCESSGRGAVPILVKLVLDVYLHLRDVLMYGKTLLSTCGITWNRYWNDRFFLQVDMVFQDETHTHTHLHSIINMSHLGQVCHVWSREFETRGCRLRDNYYLWMNIQGWTHCKRTQISKDLGVFGESSGAGNLSSKRLFGKREKSWNIFWSKGLACLEI